MTSQALSLQDLIAFDSRALEIQIGQGRGERRFLCPLCGPEKPKDAAHRCLSLELQSGLWRCHRCGQGGKIREAWKERQPEKRRQRAQKALHRAFEIEPVAHKTAPASNCAICAHWPKRGAPIISFRAVCVPIWRAKVARNSLRFSWAAPRWFFLCATKAAP